jgi:hypothetical protein
MGKKNPGNLTGVSGVHYVAAVLSSMGHIALVTVKNTKGIDLLVSNESFSKMLGIQVKTNYGSQKDWVLNEKAEELISDNVFYVFVNLNNLKQTPEYHIVPSKIVSEQLSTGHKNWLSTPGKNGQPHKDNPVRKFGDKTLEFLNRWDLLNL